MTSLAADLARFFLIVEGDVAKKQGDLTLFALFERDDLPDRWDLVVAAPWLGADDRAALEIIADEIQRVIGSQVMVALSRIVVLLPSDARVRAINQAVRVEHGKIDVNNSAFFGFPVRRAIIITSKSQDRPMSRPSQPA